MWGFKWPNQKEEEPYILDVQFYDQDAYNHFVTLFDIYQDLVESFLLLTEIIFKILDLIFELFNFSNWQKPKPLF